MRLPVRLLLYCCFFFCILFSKFCFTQNETALKSSKDCSVAIVGSILYKSEVLKNYKILVFAGDSLYCFSEVSKQRIPKIHFRVNQQYTVIINKEGFYPKKLEIDASVPDLTDRTTLATLEIDVEMTPVENFISNKFVWDIPFARIKFDNAKGKFRYVKSQLIKDNEYHFPD